MVLYFYILNLVVVRSTDEERERQRQERNKRRAAALERARDGRYTEENDPFADDEEIPPEMVWGGAVLALLCTVLGVHAYVYHCTRMSEMLSEPQIMTRMRNEEGGIDIVDDYRDVYWYDYKRRGKRFYIT